MLYHKSSSACGEIIHVRQILAELWSLTFTIFTHFSLSCLWGNNSCSSNIAGVMALEMFALQFSCLYEIRGHMFYKHALSSSVKSSPECVF